MKPKYILLVSITVLAIAVAALLPRLARSEFARSFQEAMTENRKLTQQEEMADEKADLYVIVEEMDGAANETTATGLSPKYDRIRKGMTFTQVVKVLGRPTEKITQRSNDNPRTTFIWHKTTIGLAKIDFEKGRVVHKVLVSAPYGAGGKHRPGLQ